MDENQQQKIDFILRENSIQDLTKFIEKRAYLNNCNSYFAYIFHFLQTCGMITTALSASSDFKELIWIGIGFNAAATLLSIYEKTNQNLSEKMLDDIKKIKAGIYIDESTVTISKQDPRSSLPKGDSV
jgi:hypothetical protein